MKAEQLISRYLAKHGKVTLQGIGHFYYDGPDDASIEMEKAPHFPEGAIRFDFNKNAPEDQPFIDFLSEITGKKRSLIASDLESFILTGKQFLNIGKPLIIKDLGILLKNQQGVYEFTQGSNTHEPIDISGPKSNQQQANPDDIDFSSIPKKKAGNKTMGLVLIFGLFLVILIVVIANFYNPKKNNTATDNIPADSLIIQATNPNYDSSIRKNAVIDTNQFMLVKSFKTINEAQSIQGKFLGLGYNIQINAKDSNEFALCVIVPRKTSDSSIIKDSIQKALKLQFDIKAIEKP